jgi:hypothetical protein
VGSWDGRWGGSPGGWLCFKVAQQFIYEDGARQSLYGILAFERSTAPGESLIDPGLLTTTAYAGLVAKIVDFLRKTWHGGDLGGVQPTQNEEGNRHMWLCPPQVDLWLKLPPSRRGYCTFP